MRTRPVLPELRERPRALGLEHAAPVGAVDGLLESGARFDACGGHETGERTRRTGERLPVLRDARFERLHLGVLRPAKASHANGLGKPSFELKGHLLRSSPLEIAGDRPGELTGRVVEPGDVLTDPRDRAVKRLELARHLPGALDDLELGLHRIGRAVRIEAERHDRGVPALLPRGTGFARGGELRVATLEFGARLLALGK